MLRIELPENAQLARPRLLVEAAAGVPLDILSERLGAFVTLRRSLEGDDVEFIAGTKVGSVQVGGLRVDVMPRLGSPELATLIRYALGGPVEAMERSHIGHERVGLDELLCLIFAEELAQIRQIGLSRRYVDRRQWVSALRGRPDFLGSFPWNDAGMASIVCRFHELTCDNLDNQLVLAGLERACLMAVSVDTRRKLLDHRQAWASLASPMSAAGRSEFAKARGKYTRLSEHYRLGHNLAEIILQGLSPAAVYEAGEQPTRGLYVDIPYLFERFVERLLRNAIKGRGLRIESQQSDRGALIDAEGNLYRSVRPDLMLYDQDTPVAVLDAKYKDYWEADPGSGAPKQRISNEDLYQLFFYAQRLQIRHQLATAPAAVIVSPLPAEDERYGGAVIGKRYRRVVWRAGAGDEVGVSLMLLPMTRILRALRAHRVPAKREYLSHLAGWLIEKCVDSDESHADDFLFPHPSPM
jgi:5-methylcytosine-specific restriction enzyme subunit McrC